MEYFTYIIHSEKLDILYKGYTHDPLKRLMQHNDGESRYTSGKGPWKLVFLMSHESKTAAMKHENRLKRQNRAYFEWLIKSDKNELNSFLNSE